MRFWFHFNKPASRAAKKPQISIHYKGACHIVDNVICAVGTYGRVKKTQPYFVMVGDAPEVVIKDKVAIIG